MISKIFGLYKCQHTDIEIGLEKITRNVFFIQIKKFDKCKKCGLIFGSTKRLYDNDMLVFDREQKFKLLDNDK